MRETRTSGSKRGAVIRPYSTAKFPHKPPGVARTSIANPRLIALKPLAYEQVNQFNFSSPIESVKNPYQIFFCLTTQTLIGFHSRPISTVAFASHRRQRPARGLLATWARERLAQCRFCYCRSPTLKDDSGHPTGRLWGCQTRLRLRQLYRSRG